MRWLIMYRQLGQHNVTTPNAPHRNICAARIIDNGPFPDNALALATHTATRDVGINMSPGRATTYLGEILAMATVSIGLADHVMFRRQFGMVQGNISPGFDLGPATRPHHQTGDCSG